MRTDMRRDLTAALKNRDKTAAAALRSALAAVENAEATDPGLPAAAADSEHVAGAAAGVGAAEAERRALSEADVRAIVAREADERSASAQEYERLGRADAAGRLRAEAEVLGRYLRPEA
ncbi:GatB/YqeY domain-containing protein [Streptomonospora wellingtoniae]|uniref:GatB/YqeY domain-containing protein n=1 Tax=Streptomonospora wellingtoniae TaxID=3075544 RepID=A0ABU2KQI4_9ACTN|nr:GatB/YqeY domain-containing protein [Streptomonospora sp. DSM 45055]MDT0301547.1 GatB/YqeY domain-containing protein [Streptomonospora sp. DSM 45055]